MRTRIQLILPFVVWVLLSRICWSSELYIGMGREALGEPSSEAPLGNEEILYFPGNIRIEVRDGVVRKIRGTEFSYLPPDPGPERTIEEGPTDAAAVPMKPVSAPPPPALPPADTVAPMVETVPPQAADAAPPIAEFVASPEEEAALQVPKKFDADDYYNEDFDYEVEESFEEAHPILAALVNFAVQVVVVVVILKVAFHQFGFPVFWCNLFIIAVVNSVFRVVIGLIPLMEKTRDTFFLEEILSYLFFTWSILQFTTVKTVIAALKIAAITKVVMIVFVYVVVLELGHDRTTIRCFLVFVGPSSQTGPAKWDS